MASIMSSWRQLLEQHRPSIRQRVTPLVAVKAMPTTEKPQCEPTLLSVSKTHAIFRCNTCYCLPPGRAGVNVTRSLPSRPSATGLLEACIAVRRFVGVLCVHFARIPPFPERTSAVLDCSYLRQVRTKGMVQWRSLFTNT